MTSIDSLAPELLDDIFKYIPPIRFRNLARVCRRWRDPAQRALFLTVVLHSERQAGAWLRSPARRYTRFRTQRLEIWDDTWEDALTRSVLEACPDLRFLLLYTSAAVGHKWCSSHLVQDLSTLQLAFPNRFPAGPRQHLSALATRNLRHLSVLSTDMLDPNSIKAIFLPCSNSLTSLFLGSLDIRCASILGEVFAATPFPSLRRLARRSFGGEYHSWPRLLSNLHFLDTFEALNMFQHLPTKNLITAVGASAPSTVRNLILGNVTMDDDTIIELIRILGLPNLENLHHLEISNVAEDHFKGQMGLALQLLDECKGRSISLRCHYGYITRSTL